MMRRFQTLSESESEIMQVIWRSGVPMTSGSLLNLFSHKGWKIQTLSTFLTRLVDKGVLQVEKRGRSNLYSPLLSEEEYHAQETRHLVNDLYHGDLRDFLAAFYGGRGVSRQEAEALKEWFDREAEK